MIYMMTATEIVFIKELIQQLSEVADVSDYTYNEVQQAMEILNRLTPVDVEKALHLFDDIEELELEE